MKSRPEKGNAPGGRSPEALSEKSQPTKKGTIEMNSTVVTANSQPVFNFGDSQVRLIVRDGEPWFVANDVCTALGYANTSKAIGDHLDEDERSTITNSESRNGGGQLVIINESGLYALVLRSRKPEARNFAKWVTREVLPAIRKTGQYQQPAAQGNPEIDYTRISPAQAQDLREIVKAIVDAKIQGHGETWARFQNKFRVNSYLQLPASRYEEARAYLIGKLPNGYAGAVYEENVPVERLESALAAANTVAMQVQHAALMSMMKSEDLRRGRWMVSFGYGSDAAPSVKQIDGSVCVLPIEKFHLAIEDSLSVDPQVLMQLTTTCMNKLARMAARSAKALSA